MTVGDTRTRATGTPARERALRTQGKRSMARLLDAGLRVLHERGYHAARVDDICRVANMSHGTFYLYFANKEDLFHALARECGEEMAGLAAGLGPVTPDAAGEAELRRWLSSFFATYRRYGAVVRAWMEDQVADRELQRMGLAAFANIAQALADRVRRAAGDPAPAGDPALGDPSLSTAILIALVERLAYFTSSRELALDDDDVVGTLTLIAHRGFFGAPVSLQVRPRGGGSKPTRTTRRSR